MWSGWLPPTLVAVGVLGIGDSCRVEPAREELEDMIIVDRRCPRCATKWTVHLAEWGGFCFNCRLRLDGPPRIADVDSGVVGRAPDRAAAYAFGPVELVRLERYRAAIQRHVYTDWPTTRESTFGLLTSRDSGPRQPGGR